MFFRFRLFIIHLQNNFIFENAMRTLLFFVSDIHYTGNSPENEGVVIKGFLEDLEKQLLLNLHDEVYVLIGGDLVQAADNYISYENFYNDIIIPINTLGIDSQHIICVPGNHDIQRKWIMDNRDIYAPLINQSYTEERFNNVINSSNGALFVDKFNNYFKFVTEQLGTIDCNPSGFSMELNDEWSIYCINSSLTSFAGLKDETFPNLNNDVKRLNIATRNLYEWLNKNCKRKILMLHHPFDYLTEWSASELRKIAKLNFDLILTGHTHEQDILCNNNLTESYIWCMAPQLYTDKTEKLGYCIVQLGDNGVEKIVYREWFPSRNSFRQGLDFTEQEDGIIRFDNVNLRIMDPIMMKLNDKYKETMAIYGNQPFLWLERFFSIDRFDRSYRFSKKDLYNEADIISARRNLKIITPAQYGLSSFAWHFLLKLWKEKRELGIYLDCGLIRKGVVEKVVNAQLAYFEVNEKDVKWIIFDNWAVSNKAAKQILEKTIQIFPDVPILILCPMLEKALIESEIVATSEFDFVNLYMAPLQTHQIRAIVEVYNKQKNIGEDDIVLKRLDDDIQNFNMHRTPLNCITLLEVFSNSFDDNPVNRTSVIERILRIIFENEEVPNFKSLPDVKDCEFVIGFYCEQMIRKESFYFSGKEFCNTLYDFCRGQKITLDINYLFEILLNNHIICQYDIDTYGFRFTYWVYYFAAMRMTKSEDFTNFILCNENYAHYPEVMEFYTGSDRTRNNAATIITNDIIRITSTVHDNIGMPENLNPFSRLKLNISDEQVEKAVQQLDENLQKTKLPNDIKDAIVDNQYNPSSPFHQSVYKVFENYSVNYLQEIISIASKVIRNSDYINPENKEKLFDAITKAWFDTIRVIYLMAPALAKDGIAGYDGFKLTLADSFEEYKDDPKRLLIQVIAAIPFNIIKWYKDDFFSAKLADLIFEKICSETNVVIKHILICIIIHEQPEGWHVVVRKYLSEKDSKSYYFGNTIETLTSMYANGIMSEANVARVKELIYLAYTKLHSNDNRLHPGNIKYLKAEILPQRGKDESI